jgi:ketosteroid isomerase-like protein
MKTTTALALAAVLGLTAIPALATPLSEKKQAAIRQEVVQAMQDLIAAVEHADCAAALKFTADVPEFRFADIDGQQYDYAGFKKLTTEAFAGLSALKFPRNHDILVLGPDTVLVLWHGALGMTQKDGSALHWDNYSITSLFKRLGGTWKIVFQHESGLPAQPAKTAGATSTTTGDIPVPAALNGHLSARTTVPPA